MAWAALLSCQTAGFAERAWQNRPYRPRVGQEGKDVIWVPTPTLLAEAMLDLAKVTPADFVIDLGSGDGRIVIAAAKRGARALGIEYNPDLVNLSIRDAEREGVSARAHFSRGDFFQTDFRQATVLTMYLSAELNLKLRPQILRHETRHPRPFPCLPHGRLGSGSDSGIGGPHRLFLDRPGPSGRVLDNGNRFGKGGIDAPSVISENRRHLELQRRSSALEKRQTQRCPDHFYRRRDRRNHQELCRHGYGRQNSGHGENGQGAGNKLDGNPAAVWRRSARIIHEARIESISEQRRSVH